MKDGLQWYEVDTKLLQAEIQAMQRKCPEATYGYLPDRRMFWKIPITITVDGREKNWLFLSVYDSDHPGRYFGSSIKVYPLKPSYQEMCEMVKASEVEPKHVAHVLRDGEGSVYLSLVQPEDVMESHQKEFVASAAFFVNRIERYVHMFEHGLLDQKIWDMYQH